MSRATGRLLELGLLDRINRGPSRPSEYRITSKLIELTERAETPETQRVLIEHTPQAEQEIAGKGSRAGAMADQARAYLSEISKAMSV